MNSSRVAEVELDEGRGSLPAPALGRFALLGCALAAAAVACSGGDPRSSFGGNARSVTASPVNGVMERKLAYWRAHAKEYDTVFLGSDQVLHAFVPAEFDRLMASFEYPTHSFNFGVPSAHRNDAGELLRSVLDASEGRLKRVFFEYEWPTSGKARAQTRLGRQAEWHDDEISRGQGYLCLDGFEGDEGGEAERPGLHERQQRYCKAVEALDHEPVVLDGVSAGTAPGVDVFEIRRIADEVAARGAMFVLVILPSQTCNRPLEERLQREIGAPVMRYNLPGRNPELYAPPTHGDRGCMSAEEALAFTRQLARDYPRLWLCDDDDDDDDDDD